MLVILTMQVTEKSNAYTCTNHTRVHKTASSIYTAHRYNDAVQHSRTPTYKYYINTIMAHSWSKQTKHHQYQHTRLITECSCWQEKRGHILDQHTECTPASLLKCTFTDTLSNSSTFLQQQYACKAKKENQYNFTGITYFKYISLMLFNNFVLLCNTHITVT